MKIQIGRNGKTIPTDDSWQFGIGNDHACQMLRADVCEHVKLAHDELGIRYIRMCLRSFSFWASPSTEATAS